MGRNLHALGYRTKRVLLLGQVLARGAPAPGHGIVPAAIGGGASQKDNCLQLVGAIYKTNISLKLTGNGGEKVSLHSRLSNSLVSASLKMICHLLLISFFVTKAIDCLKERGRRSC